MFDRRLHLAAAKRDALAAPGGRVAFSWWDDPSRQRIQGISRDAITEMGVSAPPNVPKGHNAHRFSDAREFLHLLQGAGRLDVAITENAATYCVPDTETLWLGGRLGQPRLSRVPDASRERIFWSGNRSPTFGPAACR